MKANAPFGVVSFSLFILLSASAALCQPFTEWRTDQETTGQETQWQIDATIHPDGAWTAVWIDHRHGYPALYAKQFDPDDAPDTTGVWLSDGLGLFGIDLNASSVQEPRLAAIGSGASLVVWAEERGGEERVEALLLSAGGQITGPITLNDPGRINSRSQPAVSSSGDRALVLWTEGESSVSRIYAQILTLDLEPLGENFLLSPDGGGRQQSGRLTPAAEGWVAAWQEESADLLDQVLMRAISPQGVLEGDPVPADLMEGWDLREPAITATSNGYLVSWIASRVDGVNIHARSFGPTLDPLAASFLVVAEDATVTPRRPEVVRVDDASVLALWTAGPAARSRFYARNVHLPEEPTGEFVVVDDPEPPEGEPLVPRGLVVVGGAEHPIRIFWGDDRDGWELVYRMGLDATGQPTGLPTQLEIDDGTASQILPSVDLFSDSGGFSTWCDFRTGGLTIYGVRLGSGAQPTSSAFRISESTGGSVSIPSTNLRDLLRNRPKVATLADGRAVVAWTTILPAGESQVFLQNFERSGEQLGNNTTLPVGDQVTGQSFPGLAPLPDSSYFVVWRDTSGDTNGNILAHRFLSDGTAVGDTTRIVDRRNEGAAQEKPSIAASGTGELVVAWIDDRRGSFDVYVQRLGSKGQKIEGNIVVSGEEETPIPQSNPDVAATRSRYVVVWDNNPVTFGSSVTGLVVTLPTAKDSGTRLDEQISFGISTGSTGYKYPRVAMAPDGRFVVTYWDTSSDSVRIVAQRFTRDAVAYGPTYSVTDLGGRTTAIPGDVSASNDSILYSWSDSREGKGWDARVRKVSWDYGGVITSVSTTTWAVEEADSGLEVRWSVPRSRAGTYFRAWREVGRRSAGSLPGPAARRVGPDAIGPTDPGGIEYRFIDVSAVAGQPTTYWIEDSHGEFAGPWSGILSRTPPALALRAIDNPFVTSARLQWVAPASLKVRISIYDLSGRRVRSLPRFEATSVRGESIWDGRDENGHDLPAGVYWARMRVEREGTRTVKLVRLR